MQINNSGITNNTNTSSKQTPVGDTTGKAKNLSDSSSAPQDSVVLSHEAQTLRQLESKIIAADDIDTAKVDSIRQAIADGSYHIDAESVAEKILSHDNS